MIRFFRTPLSHWVIGFLVFGAFPAFLSWLRPHSWIYVTLWIIAGCSWLWLRRQGVTWKQEWNRAALTRDVAKRIVLRFIPLAVALLVFAWLMIPDRLFSLPLEKPRVWVMVMIFYPLLSVVPQEVLFRSFIFRYYKHLSLAAIIAISAASFGWVHIIMQNWVAVTFSTIGGVLFADTYHKTKSLAAASFEHALYGCWIFTIGMGFYFYHGHAVREATRSLTGG